MHHGPWRCGECGTERLGAFKTCWRCRYIEASKLAHDWEVAFYVADGRREAAEKVLREIADQSYVGNYEPLEVIDIYRKWAANALPTGAQKETDDYNSLEMLYRSAADEASAYRNVYMWLEKNNPSALHSCPYKLRAARACPPPESSQG